MIHNWLILVIIAVATIFIAEKLRHPYPTFLIVVGLIIGIAPIEALTEVKSYAVNNKVFQETIILIFLSSLLGGASLNIPLEKHPKQKRPILLLSLLGTLLTFLIVTLFSYSILRLSLQQALIFGALMSITDPISVINVFKSIEVDKRLSTIVLGESLANSGISVVLFKIAIITTTLTLSTTSLAGFEFIKNVGGGLLIGGLCGYIAWRLIKTIDSALFTIGVSIVLFYGSFILAELFHLSGVIAIITAGLLFETYSRKIGLSKITYARLTGFWEVIAFLSNSLIFFLIGLELANSNFPDNIVLIFGSILIVLIARGIAVYISLFFDKSIFNSWLPIIAWGGVKGSLSMALMLSVTPDFAGRSLLLTLTFCNVLFSLLVQGTTVKTLVRGLRLK